MVHGKVLNPDYLLTAHVKSLILRPLYLQLDSTYAQKFVVSPIGGFDGDLHDFHITVDNTALITIYHIISADLTSIGGPELGWLYDGVFQEIDIATGELIFEWRSSSYYPPNSSYESIKSRGFDINSAFDYFHINSVDKDGQGRYLVSARHTHTITCISGSTGEVLWTLGGEKKRIFRYLKRGFCQIRMAA